MQLFTLDSQHHMHAVFHRAGLGGDRRSRPGEGSSDGSEAEGNDAQSKHLQFQLDTPGKATREAQEEIALLVCALPDHSLLDCGALI